jgi:AmiR/NasT family two-component response regulator
MDVARSIDTAPTIVDRVDAMSDEVSEAPLRVLLAERRASAQSDLSRRLAHLGHEVLARVTSGQGASDYAELLRPDVVLLSPVLEDGVGVLAALGLTRRVMGVAAVVLTDHPAAADPGARPNWGSVAILPANAPVEDLEFELRRAVARARSAAALTSVEVVPAEAAAAPAPADVPVQAIRPAIPADAAPAIVARPTPTEVSPPLPSMAVPARYDEEMNLIAEAAEALLERTGLSRSDALRLMEQESVDTGLSLVDVARTVLGGEGDSAGEELQAVA